MVQPLLHDTFVRKRLCLCGKAFVWQWILSI